MQLSDLPCVWNLPAPCVQVREAPCVQISSELSEYVLAGLDWTSICAAEARPLCSKDSSLTVAHPEPALLDVEVSCRNWFHLPEACNEEFLDCCKGSKQTLNTMSDKQ